MNEMKTYKLYVNGAFPRSESGRSYEVSDSKGRFLANAALACASDDAPPASGFKPADPADNNNYGWWWWSTWYNHENLRDAGAEAFATYLWDGVYDYTYVARATTPGTYVVPPARAEEMYSPEVFGRTGSETVVVE